MAKTTTAKVNAAQKKAASGPSAEVASIKELIQTCNKGREQHFKAPDTIKKYRENIRWGHEFLALVAASKQSAAQDGVSVSLNAAGNQDIINIDEFSHALNDIPNQYSAMAVELFLVEKCMNQGRSKSVNGITSAFCYLWDSFVSKYKYRGTYQYDATSGNPGRSAAVKDISKVIKNFCSEVLKANENPRTHALAMTIEDMRKLMAWSYTHSPHEEAEHLITLAESGQPLDAVHVRKVADHLFNRAFSTNHTVDKLRRRDIDWDRSGHPPYNIPYFLVSLLNRKGWQRKGNEYEIYGQPKTPEICMYTHFHIWVKFLETVLLRRPLRPDEFVFPRIRANGIVYAHEEMSYDAVQKVITHICTAAALSASYTTHCFRRGGAQYRFVFAPLGGRWSLCVIRWWGGWAEGESVDTLIRYLLDELTHYENSHRDTLCPIRREANQSFNGDHILAGPVTAEETRQLKESFNRSLEHLARHVNTTVTTAFEKLSCHPTPSLAMARSPTPMLSAPAPPRSAGLGSSIYSDSTSESLSTHTTAQASTARLKKMPIAGVAVPNLKRKGKDAWREAVDQWEHANDSMGGRALKDWPEEWYTGTMNEFTASKRKMRQVIAEEFYRYNRDKALFLHDYPTASRGFKPLFDAIQEQRMHRGEITGRTSKNGRPGERST
ncbi:hypothetical protein BS17DRAFT_706356 [Gyrodon lividus]|nr:hypothetical protein BS17DRAFT_706356 [Gyrodon lividus]